MRQDSPEDRLLHLIKGKDKRKTDTHQAASLGSKSLLAEGIKKVFLKSKVFKPAFLKLINRILVAILIIASIYFIDSFLFSPYKDVGYIPPEKRIPFTDIDKVLPEAPGVPYPKDYSVYSKDIIGKNLFSAPFVREEEGLAPELDISKRFNLVGIIAGAEPQAIIEDRDAKKTHYLYKGQSFNSVVVQEISEGKVVLNYKGKEITLVL